MEHANPLALWSAYFMGAVLLVGVIAMIDEYIPLFKRRKK